METTGTAPQEKRQFSWSGFICGLVIGVVLFLLTIQIVVKLMYSLTAA